MMFCTAKMSLLFIVLALLNLIQTGESLSCYKCVSTQPGCGTPFDWRWHWSFTCPSNNDKCVKIIERKGASEVISRNCLSQIEYSRHDIPADKYEGCRSAATDIRLAHYVNNSIKELDIKREYYDDVTWCFCEFDHFCNKNSRISSFTPLCIISITVAILLFNLKRIGVF